MRQVAHWALEPLAPLRERTRASLKSLPHWGWLVLIAHVRGRTWASLNSWPLCVSTKARRGGREPRLAAGRSSRCA